MTRAEVIEWLEKYLECEYFSDVNCFRTNCDECSHNFDSSKVIEVLTTAITLLKEY